VTSADPAIARSATVQHGYAQVLKICPVCATRFESAAWQCTACGHRPPTDNGYVLLADDVPELLEGYEADQFVDVAAAEAMSFWARSRAELIVWALRQYFPAAGSFLEVGCGTGIVLAAIREALPALRISGGDPYRPALEVAKTMDGVELLQLNALRLPFEDEFDVIGLFDVLEHVDDDEAVLREARRAARRGGGVVLTVPQHRWLWSAADDWALHRRRYTRAQLAAKLEGAGFEIVRVTSFVSLLLPALAIARSPLLSRGQYDPCREFRAARLVEPLLTAVMSAESMLIRAGLSLRAGGSLLVVATRADGAGYASAGRARVRTRSEPVGDRDQRRSAGLRLP
jgi:SAM-dependent methyltransferase